MANVTAAATGNPCASSANGRLASVDRCRSGIVKLRILATAAYTTAHSLAWRAAGAHLAERSRAAASRVIVERRQNASAVRAGQRTTGAKVVQARAEKLRAASATR